jgi:hypothetical protein
MRSQTLIRNIFTMSSWAGLDLEDIRNIFTMSSWAGLDLEDLEADDLDAWTVSTMALILAKI